MELKTTFIQLSYLISSVLFIIGIKMMGKTSSARTGNIYSGLAMLLAIAATLIDNQVLTYSEIAMGMLIGSAIGGYFAYKIPMTKMPEMVALFNGVGGLASVAVAVSEYWNKSYEHIQSLNGIVLVSIAISIFIGGITFTGSYIAYAKLNGIVSGKSIQFKSQHFINLILILFCIVVGSLLLTQPLNWIWISVLVAISLLLGVLLVIPIGGADMPVVISLLNSYSGIASCATGFVLNNYVLVISGSLVGASGIILTQIMCKAMNRSLLCVLLGGFGQASGGASASDTDSSSSITVKEVGVEESAMLFDGASSVIIVPGYGMAVAQAQHAVKELMDLLETRNISVRFAIHPVAGRMPGHMNVLLAESNVPYDKLIEMELINDDFQNTDLVLVIGANDIVNPAAKTTPGSPIFGMPVLNADKAKTVIIMKRSMAAGYAGIENELFGYPNALMLFGDAKATLNKVIAELKSM